MYAVFSTGGKQYRASIGDMIKVEKLEAEKGATIELSSVLLLGEGEDIKIGTPFLKGGKITARVVDHGRGEKIKVIKFKRRKNYMKKIGHRQYFTTLEITGIDSTCSTPEQNQAGEAQVMEAPARKAGSKKATARKAGSKKATARKITSNKTPGKEATVAKEPVSEQKGDE